MLKIGTVSFKETEHHGKFHCIDACFEMNSRVSIPLYIIKNAKVDVVQLHKQDMKREMWNRCYGELDRPVNDLIRYAMKNAGPVECYEVERLQKCISELLTMP